MQPTQFSKGGDPSNASYSGSSPPQRSQSTQSNWTATSDTAAHNRNARAASNAPSDYPRSLPSSPPQSLASPAKTDFEQTRASLDQSTNHQKRRARSSSASSGDEPVSQFEKRLKVRPPTAPTELPVESIAAHMHRIKNRSANSASTPTINRNFMYSSKVMALVEQHKRHLDQQRNDISHPKSEDRSGTGTSRPGGGTAVRW